MNLESTGRSSLSYTLMIAPELCGRDVSCRRISRREGEGEWEGEEEGEEDKRG